MTNKVIINIVYAPQTEPSHKVFENEKGEIWRSSNKHKDKINIGMGWYSIKNPNKNDHIWVVEPYCVLERDYDHRFLSGFNYIFTWASKAFENLKIKNNVIYVNHPCYSNFPSEAEWTSKWKDWDDKANEIVFVANNKSSNHYSELYSLRVQLADMLYKKSKLDVSWYGQIPLNRPFYKGKIDDKLELLRNKKFNVCTENSYDPIYTYGYFSEKLPDSFHAGTVPIYMGCYNIDDFNFPEHAYIDLRDYVKKKENRWNIDEKSLIARIEGYDKQRYINWCDDIKAKILRPQKIKELVSFQKAYSTIIDTLSK